MRVQGEAKLQVVDGVVFRFLPLFDSLVSGGVEWLFGVGVVAFLHFGYLSVLNWVFCVGFADLCRTWAFDLCFLVRLQGVCLFFADGGWILFFLE